jgi:RNA polymerase sigma-70 factor (ECF subfamily)
MLRSRATRRELPLDQVAESSDPLGPPDPEIEVLLAETVGSALQVVIDTMTPAERVAYILHDSFGFPYAEIGRILSRSPEAVRQLASRGRGRIRHTDPISGASAMPAAEQTVVDAFLRAAKNGDVSALVDVLDPQIVERIAVADQPVIEVQGAETVARRAREFSSNYTDARPALINGWPGWIAYRNAAVYSVGALAITDGRIDRMDVILDPARLTAFRIVEANSL